MNKGAALDFIACCLEVTSRPRRMARLSARINSLPLGWETVVSLANHQLVTPALWVALEKKGYSSFVPKDFHEYLGKIYALNKKRNDRLRKQAVEVVEHLNRRGIEPLLIKGSASLFRDPYGDPGSRVMADIDILVRENESELAWSTLLNLGYRPPASKLIDYDKHHHYAPLARKGDYGPIELHREVVFYSEYLSAQSAWADSRPLNTQGLAMRALSPTHQVLVNFVHSELVDENHRNGVIALRYLHEIAALAESHKSIHWDLIQKSLGPDKSYVLQSYLYLAHRLLQLEIPEGLHWTRKCSFHYLRARRCLQSDWFRLMDEKIQGFSKERHPYHTGPSAVTLGRVGYAAYLFNQCVAVALRRDTHRKTHGTHIPA